MVSLQRKREHITPVLKELHWLPVNRRIEYKILLFTYKSLIGEAPPYISELVVPYAPPRQLRSEDQKLLEYTFKWSRVRHGKRSFAAAAPELWNAVPVTKRIEFANCKTVNSFKSKLKTFLFQLEYDV